MLWLVIIVFGEKGVGHSPFIRMYVDASDCVHEWDELKRALLTNFKSLSFKDFLLKLACDDRIIYQYSNLSTLAEIVLAYPASNAEVERGFSHANVIKTKFRNHSWSLSLMGNSKEDIAEKPPPPRYIAHRKPFSFSIYAWRSVHVMWSIPLGQSDPMLKLFKKNLLPRYPQGLSRTCYQECGCHL